MKQSFFEWMAQMEPNGERESPLEIDPETAAIVVSLMARAMSAVLASVEADDDER